MLKAHDMQVLSTLKIVHILLHNRYFLWPGICERACIFPVVMYDCDTCFMAEEESVMLNRRGGENVYEALTEQLFGKSKLTKK